MITAIIRFMRRNAYRREMSLVLVLKLIAITLLWKFFFSHPKDHTLTVAELTNHYVSKDLR